MIPAFWSISFARGIHESCHDGQICAAQTTRGLYSPVTAAEIFHGVRTGEADSIAVLFSALTCIPVSGEIGRKAGEYLRKYPHSHSVELGDAPIAVTASVHDVPLWNRNKKHYPMKDVRRF